MVKEPISTNFLTNRAQIDDANRLASIDQTDSCFHSFHSLSLAQPMQDITEGGTLPPSVSSPGKSSPIRGGSFCMVGEVVFKPRDEVQRSPRACKDSDVTQACRDSLSTVWPDVALRRQQGRLP